MNNYLSDKLKVISLILMIMVVFLHSYNINVKYDSGTLSFNSDYNLFIQTFFSYGITRIAVPLFFCISGYLFFLNIKGNPSASDYLLKYKKRVKSLLIPYIFWSIWGLSLYYIMQSIPLSKEFFTNQLIVNYSFSKLLCTIFLEPIPYQLWFVRDLMVLVLFSPLIHWSLKHFRLIPILLLFILWLEIFEVNFAIFQNESVLFFSLGAFFALTKMNLVIKKQTHRYNLIFPIIWILLVFLKTLLLLFSNYEVLTVLFHKFSILTGLVSVWILYDFVMINKTNPNSTIIKVSSFSFFIFAFHEPILTIIKKGIFFMVGGSDFMSTVTYSLAPIFVISFCIFLGHKLKKNIPNLFKLITGGR